MPIQQRVRFVLLGLAATLMGRVDPVSGVVPYSDPVPCSGSVVEVRAFGGVPTLFLDDTPISGLMASPPIANWGTGILPVVKNSRLYLTNQVGNYAYRSVTTTQTFTAPYIVEATMTVRSVYNSETGASVWAQYDGASNGYFLALTSSASSGKQACLWKEEGLPGLYRQWVTVPFNWKTGQSYRLKITVNGALVSGYIDGALLGDATDPNPLPAGKVKLEVYQCANMTDDIRVSSADNATLFYDDFSLPRAWDWSGQPLEAAPSFAQMGVHLYTATDFGGANDGVSWTGPGQYDFSSFDAMMALIISFDPQARIVPRVYLDPPQWWLDANPDQAMIAYSPAGWSAPDKRASFTSQAWLADTGEFLRQFIRHINSSAYADRLVGFAYGGGSALEWVYNWNAYFHDYGTVQLTAYRNWLQTIYPDVSAIRNSWKNQSITFDTVQIPTYLQRQTGTSYDFFDPALGGRSVSDYMRFHSIAVSTAIRYFAQITKDETQRKKLVIAFYGYHLTADNSTIFMNMGHQDLITVLDCPDVDAVSCPHNYSDRQPGGVVASPIPFDSARLHGKLFFEEDDIRTHLAPTTVGSDRARNLAETLAVMKRDFAFCLSKKVPFWWMDWSNGWYDNASIMTTVQQIRQIAEQSLAKPRGGGAEIALIVSEKSIDYLRTGPSVITPLLSHQFADQILRIGAPVDVYQLADLAQMPDYKLYIFLDCFYLTAADTAAITNTVCKPGHTALWMMYSPGFVTDFGLSTTNLSNLTGITIARRDYSSACYAVLYPSGHPILNGLDPNLQWSTTDGAYGPILYANDAAATRLATLHTPPNDIPQPGMVIKTVTGSQGNWQSIWCGVPNVPVCLLRSIAEFAGVHIYVDGDDVVYANDFMVAVHARQAGPRVVRLPRAASASDPFSGQLVATNVTEFSANLADNDTGFWLLDASPGTITLSNYLGSQAGLQATVELRPPGISTPVETDHVTLDADGHFSLATGQTGIFDMTVKVPQFLRALKPAVTLPTSTPITFTLTGGDADDDNEITSSDLAIVLAAINTSSGDPAFDARADLNGDGAVNTTDLTILLTGMDMAGAE